MESTRKRLRYCEHCSQTVTYPVYKKHKEEFYDPTSKQWTITHHSAKKGWKSFDPSLDAEDDEIISCAISSTGTVCIHTFLNHDVSLWPYSQGIGVQELILSIIRG